MGVGGQRHAQAALFPGKGPVPVVLEPGWAPGLIWTGAENLSSTGIRSPDRPARSESLYRLSYPGPNNDDDDDDNNNNNNNNNTQHQYSNPPIFRKMV